MHQVCFAGVILMGVFVVVGLGFCLFVFLYSDLGKGEQQSGFMKVEFWC